MPRKFRMKQKESYTIPERARLGGISEYRMRRVLLSVGIAARKVESRHLVFVADIRARLPALWDSILLCARARSA